jgi:hypothetical protein
LLASHDAGWNDPPSWAAVSSPNPAGETSAKRILNKRVAFPLNSKTEQPSPSLHQNISPTQNILQPVEISKFVTTTPHKPIIATSINTEDPYLEIEINKDKALKDILDNLHFVMKQLDLNKTYEIQKRLDRMQVMWNEDKLSNVVQKKLLKMSEGIFLNF